MWGSRGVRYIIFTHFVYTVQTFYLRRIRIYLSLLGEFFLLVLGVKKLQKFFIRKKIKIFQSVEEEFRECSDANSVSLLGYVFIGGLNVYRRIC